MNHFVVQQANDLILALGLNRRQHALGVASGAVYHYLVALSRHFAYLYLS